MGSLVDSAIARIAGMPPLTASKAGVGPMYLRKNAAATPPSSSATMYTAERPVGILPVTHKAIWIAGLKTPPEMWAMIETMLAWALLEGGEEHRAGTLVGGTVTRGRAQGEKLALPDALRVQGMVFSRQGQHDEAAAALEEGLALARSLPTPYAEGRILVELGRLEEALVIFRRLGALKDVERTEAALAESA